MKRLLTTIMAISAIFAVNSCSQEEPLSQEDSVDQEEPVTDEDDVNNGPVVTWTSNPNFDVLDITDELDANITVTASAGISSFVVTVDSEVLEAAFYDMGIQTAELDLINDETVIQILDTVTEGQLPTGSDLAGQTEANFDISSLVLMINELTTEDSYHSFILNVTDTEGESAQATCTFHRIGEENPVYAEPTITWEGNENFSVMELQEEMSVKIIINAPAGIQSLVVDVESAPLNTLGIRSIDFVNPGDMSDIVSMVLGDQDITTAVELNLDLSNLVPMILLLEPEDDSFHVFTLNLTDNLGRTLNKSLTFHYTGTSDNPDNPDNPDNTVSLEMSEVDLWNNTAVLTVSGSHESVAYRVASTGEWISLTGTDGVYNISPEWNSLTNDAGLTVYTPKDGSGIFAGNTYQFKIDNKVVEYAYTAEEGDDIPNGDMTSWSTKSMPGFLGFGTTSVSYPNASGDSFWDSGNNYYAKTLCQESSGAAYLKASTYLGILTPGNMYTGDFSMSGTTGSAKMGKQYSWTARPKAFKFDYKASVGTIDKVGSSDNSSYSGQQDVVHVYAAVVNWSGQHVVTSGTSTPTGIWDPATQTSVDKGQILGYASFETSTSNTDSFTTAEIPFVWYDYESKPTEGNYTIVISCSTSKRGDYLTGCSSNYMYLDNFEWVY